MLEEAEYKRGVLHGITRTFHENGQLSSETYYDSGRVHGLKKKYRKDGTKAYEAPYHYDHPCVGLKEYFLSGNPVNNYPEIVVKPKNELLKNNTYTVEFSLSDGRHAVEFFRGNLTKEKYIPDNAEPLPTLKGIGRLYYILPPGTFMMERVNIIAKIKTDLGNFLIREISYNVAVENR